MRNKIITVLVLMMISSLMVFAQNADDIVGLWYSQPDSKNRISIVEVYKENNKYYGYSFAYQNSTDIVNDVNNPDQKLRNLPLKGLVYLYDLQFSKGEWKGGKIYNPEQGKTYNAKASLSDNKQELNIKASIDGAGLFGKTLTWKKVPANEISKYKPLNRSELRRMK